MEAKNPSVFLRFAIWFSLSGTHGMAYGLSLIRTNFTSLPGATTHDHDVQKNYLKGRTEI